MRRPAPRSLATGIVRAVGRADQEGMDAAAQFPGSAPGLLRLLEHCRLVGCLTQTDQGSARGRLEDALGPELTCRLVGALANSRRHVVAT